MWESIEYTPDKMQEILDMTAEYYGTDNDIADYNFINHEYFENNCGNAFIKLAYDTENSVLAGQYVVIPVKVKVGKEICNAILSLNTLTREQYRGQKIFISLAQEVYDQCKENGYKFCYGAPNPNSHPGFLKRLQFHDVGVMPLYLKILHPSLLVKEKTKLGFLGAIASPFNLFFKPYKKASEAKIVKITDKNVNMFDEFWNEIKDKYEVMGVRDSAYISWRYLNMPKRDYEVYAAVKDNKIVSYCVGRVVDVAGMKCGMLVDFLIKKDNRDSGIALVSYFEKKFYQDNVGLMGCLMQKNAEEAQIIDKMGFFVCPKKFEPQPFPIILREFNELDRMDLLESFDKWFFTMGDYDVI